MVGQLVIERWGYRPYFYEQVNMQEQNFREVFT